MRRLWIVPIVVFIGAFVFVCLPFRDSGTSHGPAGTRIAVAHCRAPIVIGWSGSPTTIEPNGQRAFESTDSCHDVAQARLILAGAVVVLVAALCGAGYLGSRKETMSPSGRGYE